MTVYFLSIYEIKLSIKLHQFYLLSSYIIRGGLNKLSTELAVHWRLRDKRAIKVNVLLFTYTKQFFFILMLRTKIWIYSKRVEYKILIGSHVCILNDPQLN